MSNIATKLTYLNGTKQAIKQAINEDFEVIDNNTTFREYADEISSNNAKYKDLIPKETTNATNTLDISNSSGLDKALVTQYGNTYQEGEPTPDTPQEIVNISGKSNVKVVGKNLFNPTNYVHCYCNDSEQKFVSDSGSTIVYVKAKPNTKYTFVKIADNRFSGGASPNKPIATGSYTASTRLANNTGTKLTITTSANDNYVWAWVYQGNASPSHTEQETLNSIMIVEGETAPTSYEPYKEQSYEINLGYNLFKTPYNESSKTKNGITFTINEDSSIHVEGTATAKTQFNLRNRDLLLGLNIGERYTIATSGLGTVDSTIWLDTYGQTGNFLGRWSLSSSTPYTSAVAEAKDNKPLISITVENGATINTDVKVWLYKGAYDSSIEYTPYITPIELCKIGDYKDRIYPLNGKWYLEKKIGKVVLNGSENWRASTTNENYSSFFFTKDDMMINKSLFSNYFSQVSIPTLTNATGVGIASHNTLTRIYFGIETSTASTRSAFLTWLSTHNTTVYYVLATPTTEEITESNYPTLYNQLNNIKLYEGVNHLTFTNESGLDVEFDITYYKDWKLD